MTISRQVKCIKKDNKNERITHIGGDWGQVTEEKAISQIENKEYRYFVRVQNKEVDVIVKGYLATEPDGTTVNNLLNLPGCK